MHYSIYVLQGTKKHQNGADGFSLGLEGGMASFTESCLRAVVEPVSLSMWSSRFMTCIVKRPR